MSEYIIHNGTFYECDSEELMHYGVLGMRWGVRRSAAQLRSSDSARQAKGVASLQKHREKGTAKIGKLKAKGVKLEQKHEQRIIKDESKAAKLNQKAAKHRRKAASFFRTNKSANKHFTKAVRLETKANLLTAKANDAKAKINKNNAMISAFEREIRNIDAAMVSYGSDYVKKRIA